MAKDPKMSKQEWLIILLSSPTAQGSIGNEVIYYFDNNREFRGIRSGKDVSINPNSIRTDIFSINFKIVKA